MDLQRRNRACFLLLLLLLLQLHAERTHLGLSGFGVLGLKLGPSRHQDSIGGGADVFGEEKRNVFTGPNPLHNR
ncbi:hypothetical protein HPP92_012062 [Vanilla planifolia]|uniref:Uncharacterized protein n=1 Tax=Vanilla planifolia TaxID=51239 RepID=A0A835QYT8_VANPL|nr:hypothetical protein HPP92_012062 [Vanilla planifolia]